MSRMVCLMHAVVNSEPHGLPAKDPIIPNRVSRGEVIAYIGEVVNGHSAIVPSNWDRSIGKTVFTHRRHVAATRRWRCCWCERCQHDAQQ